MIDNDIPVNRSMEHGCFDYNLFLIDAGTNMLSMCDDECSAQCFNFVCVCVRGMCWATANGIPPRILNVTFQYI